MVQPPTPGLGEVHRGPPRGHLAPPWPGPGCAHPAQVRRSLALRRLINTRGGPPRGGQGRAGLRDQWWARLIHGPPAVAGPRWPAGTSPMAAATVGAPGVARGADTHGAEGVNKVPGLPCGGPSRPGPLSTAGGRSMTGSREARGLLGPRPLTRRPTGRALARQSPRQTRFDHGRAHAVDRGGTRVPGVRNRRLRPVATLGPPSALRQRRAWHSVTAAARPVCTRASP